jgi:hypothetical protein
MAHEKARRSIMLEVNKIVVLGWMLFVAALALATAPAQALDGKLYDDEMGRLWLPADSFPSWHQSLEEPPGIDTRSDLALFWSRLLSLPLRPVSIGEKPHRPDDPEPGVGVVLRLAW